MATKCRGCDTALPNTNWDGWVFIDVYKVTPKTNLYTDFICPACAESINEFFADLSKTFREKLFPVLLSQTIKEDWLGKR